jgi:hypothetical protein
MPFSGDVPRNQIKFLMIIAILVFSCSLPMPAVS